MDLFFFVLESIEESAVGLMGEEDLISSRDKQTKVKGKKSEKKRKCQHKKEKRKRGRKS